MKEDNVKKLNLTNMKDHLGKIIEFSFSQRDFDKKRLIQEVEEVLKKEESQFKNSKLSVQLKRALSRSQYELVKLDINPRMAIQETELMDLNSLVLDEENRILLERFFKEHRHKEMLKENNLTISHKLFLYGPPGNGKTSLASAIAKKMDLPFFIVKLSGVVDSLLGATSKNLSELFDKLKNQDCVLLLDELESLLFSREGLSGDSASKENINIVSSLLQCIDKAPDNIILVTATNNDKLIDHAVKRRFNHIINIGSITQDGIKKYIDMFAEKHEKIPVKKLVEENDFVLESENFAVLKNNLINISKKHLLENLE